MNRRAALFASVLLAISLSTMARSQTPHETNVAFVVWDGVELIEFAGPAQIFASIPGYNEYTVAESREPIRSYFVTIVPDFTFDTAPMPEIVVVPSGTQVMSHEALNRWLRRTVRNARAVLTVCNGSLILANAGLLDGHEATAPIGNLDDLMILGRDIKAYANRRYQESGKFVTSQSYFAGVDGTLHLVNKLHGDDVALDVARRNEYDWTPEKFSALHAKPGVTPRTRRFVVYTVLMNEGLEQALRQYRNMVADGALAYPAPLDQIPEDQLFQWLAWNLERAGRFEEANKINQFMAAVFESAAPEAGKDSGAAQ